jgi:hypothetical protein
MMGINIISAIVAFSLAALFSIAYCIYRAKTADSRPGPSDKQRK